MAIPILNHMDFQKAAEIQNVLLHTTGSGDVSSPGTGQIIYDSGSVKVYNGSSWLTLASGGGTRAVGVDTDGNGSVNNTLELSEDLVLKKGSGVSLSEAGGVVTIAATGTQLTAEQVEDMVGGMLDGTETGISVSYDDTNGNLDFVIGAGDIVHSMLAGDAVDGDNIGDDVVNSEHIAAGAVDTEHIADANVTTAKLASNAVTTVKITDANVTTGKIADANVTTAKIADDNVTYAKIQNVAANNVLLGNDDGAGSGIQELTKANVLTLLNVEDGADVTDTANVKSALNASFGGAGTIGDSSDTFTIPGNLIVSGTQTVQNETIQVVENNTIQFEGATADAHEVKLTAADATADRTITLPNVTGHVPLLAVAATETITSTPAELNLLDGITVLSGSNTGDEPDASVTVKGIVELATGAEHVTGTDSARAATVAGIGKRNIHATIDVSDSNFTSNLYAEIDHGLGTEDVIVQLFDSSSKQQIIAEVNRTDKAGSASTSKIKIIFAVAPANDVEVMISSTVGAGSGAVAYS